MMVLKSALSRAHVWMSPTGRLDAIQLPVPVDRLSGC